MLDGTDIRQYNRRNTRLFEGGCVRLLIAAALIGAVLLLPQVGAAETTEECQARCASEKSARESACQAADDAYESRGQCLQDAQDAYAGCLNGCQQPPAAETPQEN